MYFTVPVSPVMLSTKRVPVTAVVVRRTQSVPFHRYT